ncbi:MAG: hypothetical protein ACREVJ_10425 [Gammaproteobacteria bacterium]
MTTIAWDGESLASDTLAFASIKCRVRKLYRLPDGALFGAAGACQQVLEVLAWLNGGDKPTVDLDNFDGLFITAAGVVENIGTRLMREPVLEPFYAIGSGAPFAMTAMACGCSAVEAVRMAIRFDPGSGGRVERLKLRRRDEPR